MSTIKEAPLNTGETPISLFDMAKLFIRHTIDTRGRSIISSDGAVHDIYPWAAMARADDIRLQIQEVTGWGRDYRRAHSDLPAQGAETIGIIGVSGRAEQVQHLLSIYPKASFDVIEVDPNKYNAAKETLTRTNPNDLATGRLTLVNEDAIKYLSQPEQAGKYNYLEADKVEVHLQTAHRQQLAKAIEAALIPGGVYYRRDLLIRTWRVSAADGYEQDVSTLQTLSVLARLMPRILDNTWTERGAPIWETPEEMSTEPTRYASSLKFVDSTTRVYTYDHTKGDDPEGLISQLISTMPALGIEVARLKQPDNQGLATVAEDRWGRAEDFVEGVKKPGVRIAMPDYVHACYRRT